MDSTEDLSVEFREEEFYKGSTEAKGREIRASVNRQGHGAEKNETSACRHTLMSSSPTQCVPSSPTHITDTKELSGPAVTTVAETSSQELESVPPTQAGIKTSCIIPQELHKNEESELPASEKSVYLNDLEGTVGQVNRKYKSSLQDFVSSNKPYKNSYVSTVMQRRDMDITKTNFHQHPTSVYQEPVYPGSSRTVPLEMNKCFSSLPPVSSFHNHVEHRQCHDTRHSSPLQPSIPVIDLTGIPCSQVSVINYSQADDGYNTPESRSFDTYNHHTDGTILPGSSTIPDQQGCGNSLMRIPACSAPAKASDFGHFKSSGTTDTDVSACLRSIIPAPGLPRQAMSPSQLMINGVPCFIVAIPIQAATTVPKHDVQVPTSCISVLPRQAIPVPDSSISNTPYKTPPPSRRRARPGEPPSTLIRMSPRVSPRTGRLTQYVCVSKNASPLAPLPGQREQYIINHGHDRWNAQGEDKERDPQGRSKQPIYLKGAHPRGFKQRLLGASKQAKQPHQENKVRFTSPPACSTPRRLTDDHVNLDTESELDMKTHLDNVDMAKTMGPVHQTVMTRTQDAAALQSATDSWGAKGGMVSYRIQDQKISACGGNSPNLLDKTPGSDMKIHLKEPNSTWRETRLHKASKQIYKRHGKPRKMAGYNEDPVKKRFRGRRLLQQMQDAFCQLRSMVPDLPRAIGKARLLQHAADFICDLKEDIGEEFLSQHPQYVEEKETAKGVSHDQGLESDDCEFTYDVIDEGTVGEHEAVENTDPSREYLDNTLRLCNHKDTGHSSSDDNSLADLSMLISSPAFGVPCSGDAGDLEKCGPLFVVSQTGTLAHEVPVSPIGRSADVRDTARFFVPQSPDGQFWSLLDESQFEVEDYSQSSASQDDPNNADISTISEESLSCIGLLVSPFQSPQMHQTPSFTINRELYRSHIATDPAGVVPDVQWGETGMLSVAASVEVTACKPTKAAMIGTSLSPKPKKKDRTLRKLPSKENMSDGKDNLEDGKDSSIRGVLTDYNISIPAQERKRKLGRPRKDEQNLGSKKKNGESQTAKKPRGRPRKYPKGAMPLTGPACALEQPAVPVPRPRGRPRKQAPIQPLHPPGPVQSKKRFGRPRKQRTMTFGAGTIGPAAIDNRETDTTEDRAVVDVSETDTTVDRAVVDNSKIGMIVGRAAADNTNTDNDLCDIHNSNAVTAIIDQAYYDRASISVSGRFPSHEESFMSDVETATAIDSLLNLRANVTPPGASHPRRSPGRPRKKCSKAVPGLHDQDGKLRGEAKKFKSL
ncbi:uncharacterized protein LOC116621104 isoform X2 [Nematostella vectensis]|uniref:uncharacterized protein LOC116621104 isoform X2 n=1 Tax=Nematostella vectensis TaxID=45351 RepID=UPI002077280A|nr:uncharacterized protein LOC116621104 isoform X2 [Nematostella vectensis]